MTGLTLHNRLCTPSILFAVMLAAAARSAGAIGVYPLPPPDVDVVGEIRIDYARYEDTLLEIARRNGLGYEEIRNANPGVDPWLPGAGTPIVLPTRHILPDAPRDGLVLNVPEMRLYYYPRPGRGEKPVVMTFPVSVGRMDWRTPLGTTRVTAKQKNPAWYPPESIRREHAARGDYLPGMVPPGPDNPLGHRVLRLGLPAYLIHGTNNPNGIGMRVTHGCVRMYPEDVERLYDIVPVGTPVHIVNQPVKAGWFAGTLFLEAHPGLEEDGLGRDEMLQKAYQAVRRKLGHRTHLQVDSAIVDVVVDQQSGLVVDLAPQVAQLN